MVVTKNITIAIIYYQEIQKLLKENKEEDKISRWKSSDLMRSP
jgi:hypothetical protein